MDVLSTYHEQAPACMLSGALAHLAQHMENGCPRSAYLAVMLLEQIAADPRADRHLRQHSQQLAEILERDPIHTVTSDIGPGTHRSPRVQQSISRKCA